MGECRHAWEATAIEGLTVERNWRCRECGIEVDSFGQPIGPGTLSVRIEGSATTTQTASLNPTRAEWSVVHESQGH